MVVRSNQSTKGREWRTRLIHNSLIILIRGLIRDRSKAASDHSPHPWVSHIHHRLNSVEDKMTYQARSHREQLLLE